MCCKCRKRLVDNLSEGCTENIEEKRIVENEQENKCSSGTVYFVLFSILLTISIGIATYFAYYKCISRNEKNVSKYDYL